MIGYEHIGIDNFREEISKALGFAYDVKFIYI